jgi:hypothetical protein
VKYIEYLQGLLEQKIHITLANGDLEDGYLKGVKDDFIIISEESAFLGIPLDKILCVTIYKKEFQDNEYFEKKEQDKKEQSRKQPKLRRIWNWLKGD